MPPEKRCTSERRTTPCRAAVRSSLGQVVEVAGLELLDPGGRGGAQRRLPGDQVTEHRAGLDRRELVGVTDEHQPAVGAQRLHQPGHQGQRHHRRLVHDDHVVGQPVEPVVPEPAAGPRPPAQQPVQRRGGQRAEPVPVLGGEAAGDSGDGLGQPGGGLAGGGGERDPQRRPGLVGEHRQQLGDGGGLAGARTTGEHADPAVGGDHRCQPLPVRAAAPGTAGRSPRAAGRRRRRAGVARRRRRARRRCRAPGASSGRGTASPRPAAAVGPRHRPSPPPPAGCARARPPSPPAPARAARRGWPGRHPRPRWSPRQWPPRGRPTRRAGPARPGRPRAAPPRRSRRRAG